MQRAALYTVLIVISDLHVGAGPLDDFDHLIEAEFVAFLEARVLNPAPQELVINGDFLEFVQAEPWEDLALRSVTADGEMLCFTQAQSLSKLANIFEYHPNVFRALGLFLGKPENRLVILPGNHDADFFFEAVRAALRAKLDECASMIVGDRLVFHLDRVYRPAIAPCVWIEHGHQYDVNNCFYLDNEERWSEERPPLLVDINGNIRLLACTGTRFLNEYLNRLDLTYTFVDNVKPFSKFVKMFLVASALFRYGTPVRVAIAAWGILRFLAKTATISMDALLHAGGRDIPSVAEIVRQGWSQLPKDQQRGLIDALVRRGVAIDVPIPELLADKQSVQRILDALADNFDLTDVFILPNDALMGADGENGTLSFTGGFVADETATLIQAAQAAIRDAGAKVVIMGHTHEPQDRPNGLNYGNTGSWTRYLRIAEGEPEPTSWSLLKADGIAHFPFELLYAEIDTGSPACLRLKKWQSPA
jgi:UDP-2,3-diacylglucosamine pyrophosphatase LpxH